MMYKKKILIVFVTLLVVTLSYGQNIYDVCLDTLPKIDIQYFVDHPLRNTIKRSTNSTLELIAPPIGNQGNLNSCVGWAMCYSAASIRLYDKLHDWNLALCSPSYLFNQCKHSYATIDTTNCDSVYSNMFEIGNRLTLEGTCSYSMMQYTTNCNTQPTVVQKIDALNKRFTVNELSITNNPNIFKTALNNGWPIVVGMPQYYSFVNMWNDPTAQGVWSHVDTTDYNHNDVGHATCIVGYDDTKEAFKVMNSWGTSGGDNGFYWASYDVVQQGAFRVALMVINTDTAQIEGPTILTDSSWYYIRNVPSGATIDWTITNNTTNPMYTLVTSSSDSDSVYVANRSTSLNPWNPLSIDDSLWVDGIHPPLPVHRGTLSVSISCGTATYTAQKTIRESMGSLSKMPLLIGSTDETMLNIRIQEGERLFENGQTATLSLIHPIYGRMRAQRAYDANSQMSIADLPEGVYILLLQQSGRTIAETKVMIP